MFKTVGTTTGSPNGQHNGLGVAFDGTAGPVRLETTLVNPPAGIDRLGAGRAVVRHERGQLRQARARVATSTTQMRVQLLREIDGVSNGAAPADEINTGRLQQPDGHRPAEPGPDPGHQHRVRHVPDRHRGAGHRRARSPCPPASSPALPSRPAARRKTFAGIFATHRNRAATPASLVYPLRRVPADQRPDRPGRPDRADRHDRRARPRSASTGPTTARPTWPATTCTGRPTPKARTRRSPRAPSRAPRTPTPGLTSGTLYAYQVRALDTSGNVSAASAAATALPDAASPPGGDLPGPGQLPVRDRAHPDRLHPRLRPELRQRPGLRLGRARHGHPAQPGRQRPRPERRRRPPTSASTRSCTCRATTSPNFANVALPGAWEIAVPNGTYSVEVSVGDPTPGRRPDVPRAQRRGRQRHQQLRAVRRRPAARAGPVGDRHRDGQRRPADDRPDRRHEHQDQLRRHHAPPTRRRPRPR